MGAKIVWTKRALKSYSSQVDYLLKEWSEKEVAAFAELTSDKLQAISIYPGIGRQTSKQHPFLRQVVLNKRIILVYKIVRNDEIHLIYFWNTHQNPAKKPI